MARKRHVVEGIWSGYNGAKPCHRIVTKYPERFRAITCIGFNDGTRMSLSVRLCSPREKVQEIHGYDSLLQKVINQKLEGFVHVNDIKD